MADAYTIQGIAFTRNQVWAITGLEEGLEVIVRSPNIYVFLLATRKEQDSFLNWYYREN